MSNDDYRKLFRGDQDDEPTLESDFARRYRIGDHAKRPDVDPDDLIDMSKAEGNGGDELGEALENAAEIARERTEVEGFTCPVCALTHGHSDTKESHDIRDELDVRPAFAEEMDFHPACHCGIHELSALLDFYPFITVDVFEDAEQYDALKDVEPRLYITAMKYGVSDGIAALGMTGNVTERQRDALRAFRREKYRPALSVTFEDAPVPTNVKKELDGLRDIMQDETGFDPNDLPSRN